MSAENFQKLPYDERSQQWWKVLCIEQPRSFKDSKNQIKSLDKLAELYRLNAYLDRTRSGWLKALVFDGQVTCKVCYRSNSTYGLVACRIDGVRDHLKTAFHIKCAKEQEDSRQPKIDDTHGGAGPGGMTLDDRIITEDSKKTEALLIGSFVAGGKGAAGLPPSSIHELLNKNVLNILHHQLKAGIPSTTHIIHHTLPDAIKLLEDRMRSLLKGTPISLFIDGGTASHLAMGRKVIVICANSMKWKQSLLLHVSVSEKHETSDFQRDQIKEVVKKLAIEPKNIHYLCADNGSANGPTVVKLNEEVGYKMEYARCLPHCLNLVVKSFTNVMDIKFKISTHLKLARRFLTAGGGLARKLLAVEFGFAVSGIDFSETRWASLVAAILYVANVPTKINTDESVRRLKVLAKEGDETAKAALDDNAPEREIFFILFDLFQSVSEQQLAEEKKRLETNDDVTTADLALTAARQSLLAYYCQPINYLAFQAMEYLFGGDMNDVSLKTIFTITQGNPDFAAKLTSTKTGVVPDCVSATKSLIRRLRSLHYKWARPEKVDQDFSASERQSEPLTESQFALRQQKRNVMDARDRLRKRLDEKMKRFCDKTYDYYKHINCDIMEEGKPFNADVAKKWKESNMALYNTTTAGIVLATVYDGIVAIEKAEGLQKTLECLAGLENSQVFDVNREPKTFSSDRELLNHIGGADHSHAETLMSQWRKYCKEWKMKKNVLSPVDVYSYWEGKRDDWNILAPYAMRMFSRPVSSAACERIFSFMEGMNRKDRCNMEALTLQKVLFVRGNSKTMKSLLQDENASRIQAELEQDAMERAKSTSDAMQEAIELDVDDDVYVAPVISSVGKTKKRKLTQPDRPPSPTDTDDE